MLKARLQTHQKYQQNRINKKRSSSIIPFVFECTLDGMPVGYSTFTNLAAGQHTFSVAALDNLVNQDPQPPVFRWTINAVIPTNTANTLHAS